MISKTSLQIIKALLELSQLTFGTSQGAKDIAKRIGAPSNYLSKTLQKLAKQGIVASQKGIKGGFKLVKPASQITLYEVVTALEDLGRWEGCFMGKAKCSEKTACSVHHKWGAVSQAYVHFLKSTVISDLKIT